MFLIFLGPLEFFGVQIQLVALGFFGHVHEISGF